MSNSLDVTTSYLPSTFVTIGYNAAGSGITTYTTIVYEIPTTITETPTVSPSPSSSIPSSITITSPIVSSNTVSPSSPNSPTSTSQSITLPPATKSISPSSTSPSSSRSPSPTPGPTKNDKTISSGAAAGIGIGSAVVGALIAFIITWCLLRRRRSSHTALAAPISKEPEFTDISNARSQSTLGANLLERVDDSAIQKAMQEINVLVDGHISYYCHLHKFNGSTWDIESKLVDSGYVNSGDLTVEKLVPLLINPATRVTALRHVIMAILISHGDWNSPVKTSLLPTQIATFCKTIPEVERQYGSQEVFDKALAQWRHLTAFLLQPLRSTRDPPNPSKADLSPSINLNVSFINMILTPFLKSIPDSQRFQEQNLAGIVFKVAQLALILFSQPSNWRFGWTLPGSSEIGEKQRPVVSSTQAAQGERPKEALVVCPSLSEVVERNGSGNLRQVVEAVAVEIYV